MIKIDETFYLEPTSFSWNLRREENTGVINEETGKEIISRDIWYCTDLKRALQVYANESLKSSKTIEELFEGLERVNETIKNLKI